jgi:hypothetical protein
MILIGLTIITAVIMLLTVRRIRRKPVRHGTSRATLGAEVDEWSQAQPIHGKGAHPGSARYRRRPDLLPIPALFLFRLGEYRIAWLFSWPG